MEKEAKACQGKDIFERMNYLYQASHLIALKNRVAASYYGNTMMGCAKKSVLRIEPNIKRTICKRCQSPLIPGETARVRLCSKHMKGIKWTCLVCLNSKKYPTKRGYKLWIDQPEAIVETLHYVPKKISIDCDKNEMDNNKKSESSNNMNIEKKNLENNHD
ncbi:ribonuclease P protein subunit p21 [Vespa velutina]|uniref:ribonuclease P protein subunit p21 n=1 Tax=Vespa velutina TaxID=202808 RepID=UPI001FB5667E|nr:ribonuclease P protein subunit p21 [Vespa velutina]XP_047366720.1 ribonuclease P protein subunit p21 [Vespa velutina]XP_047366722.1 ribonuclease P protein subunit p21 [Vespa velutina]XP_047366723.1 ribonuclease P protein subunit p21 [Vespa velutina]XP_047366724.1 ribonuclease P protein subunit p21 [Vespa velutina]XP_047366725.1 ribonuclease P protein subunit p21 [Vespa velutina]XP_047366726.1 ribonuclease P protein subunit p21 [Vespa velutina]XP_047366727.1 ribonuclease P protein subunit 